MDGALPKLDWVARYLGALATQRQLSPHTISAYRRDLLQLAEASAGQSSPSDRVARRARSRR